MITPSRGYTLCILIGDDVKQKYLLTIIVLIVSFLLLNSCEFISISDEEYITNFVNNKESFESLKDQLSDLTDSINARNSNERRSREITLFHYDDLDLLNSQNHYFTTTQQIRNIYHYSNSSVRISPVTSVEFHPEFHVFTKHKYYEFFWCGEPTVIVSTLDSLKYYEREGIAGQIHRDLGDGWYLGYNWDNNSY